MPEVVEIQCDRCNRNIPRTGILIHAFPVNGGSYCGECWQLAKTERDMQLLIDAFPTLKRRGIKWVGDTSAPFIKQMKGMSHGERCAADFVLSVWDTHNKFNFHEAMSVWDSEHVAVVIEWMRQPWWK